MRWPCFENRRGLFRGDANGPVRVALVPSLERRRETMPVPVERRKGAK